MIAYYGWKRPVAGRYQLKPRVGDAVWDEERHQVEKKHPNGTITRIMYEDHEVIVTFTDGGWKSFDFDELLGNWHAEKFGGTWMLHHEARK